MKSFTQLIPVGYCLDKNGVSKLIGLAYGRSQFSGIADGLSNDRIVKVAAGVSCCLDFTPALAEGGRKAPVSSGTTPSTTVNSMVSRSCLREVGGR